jgi:urea-proton symporter
MAGAGGACPPPGLGFGGQYYSVVDGVCTRAASYFGEKPVLDQAVGYAVVLGFGAFFALFTSFLVKISTTTPYYTFAAPVLSIINVPIVYT